METNLRPLTLGEILDRTAQLYRTNFWLFAGIFSVYAGVGLVLNLLQLGLVEWLRAHHLATKLVWVPIAAATFEFIILFLFIGASIAAISRAVASVHLGELATIRGSYASTLPNLGRYLWMMTITFFLAWLPMAVLYGVAIGVLLRFKSAVPTNGAHVAVAQSAAQQHQTIVMGLIFLVLFILMIPAFIYTVWMSLRYSLAVPACVIENIKARPAIRRSIELSHGARWRILVLFLLIGAIKIGLIGLTQAFVVVAAVKHHGQLPAALTALSNVIAFFTNTFLGPIGAAGVTLFYFDQRVRKEGYDIEWMMQTAGFNTLSPALAEITLPVPVDTSEPPVLTPAAIESAPHEPSADDERTPSPGEAE